MKPELENKVLLPLLEDQYGKVLEAQKAAEGHYRDGEFYIQYHEKRLPLEPAEPMQLLGSSARRAQAGHQNPSRLELVEPESILTASTILPRYDETHLRTRRPSGNARRKW